MDTGEGAEKAGSLPRWRNCIPKSTELLRNLTKKWKCSEVCFKMLLQGHDEAGPGR